MDVLWIKQMPLGTWFLLYGRGEGKKGEWMEVHTFYLKEVLDYASHTKRTPVTTNYPCPLSRPTSAGFACLTCKCLETNERNNAGDSSSCVLGKQVPPPETTTVWRTNPRPQLSPHGTQWQLPLVVQHQSSWPQIQVQTFLRFMIYDITDTYIYIDISLYELI